MDCCSKFEKLLLFVEIFFCIVTALSKKLAGQSHFCTMNMRTAKNAKMYGCVRKQCCGTVMIYCDSGSGSYSSSEMFLFRFRRIQILNRIKTILSTAFQKKNVYKILFFYC